jgi:hypothetical protein
MTAAPAVTAYEPATKPRAEPGTAEALIGLAIFTIVA